MYRIRLDPYGLHCKVYVGSAEWSDFSDRVRREGGDLPDIIPTKSDGGLTWGITMWLAGPRIADRFIIHECVHVASELNRFVGVDDEEVLAYTVGWLFDAIKKRLNRRKE